jgi:hypothetical protein
LNNIRERFTNPLIFSFIIFWLTVNWRITIALFWYDTKEVEQEGYSTIFEFIKDNVTAVRAFLIPFSLAVGYTFLFPIIKNVIKAFYAWTFKWGEIWHLNIMKEGKIPFERYFKLREEYDKRSKILQENIDKETEFFAKYDSISTEIIKYQTEVNELRQLLTENNSIIHLFRDIRLLNGYWINTYEDSIQPRLKGSEEIFIEDGKYYLVRPMGKRVHVFNITNFYFDSTIKTVFFTKERYDQEPAFSENKLLRYNINILKFEREDLLIGHENGTTKIQYQRQDPLKLKFVVPTKRKSELEKVLGTIQSFEGVVEVTAYESEAGSLNLNVSISKNADRRVLTNTIESFLNQ